MTASGDGDDSDAAMFAVLEPVVRRVVAARIHRRDVIDDLVQETLLRGLAARPKLELEALIAYTIVSVQRVVASHLREDQRHQRLEPRLADVREPDLPEAAASAEEERRAVRAALTRLSQEERTSLLAHDVSSVDRAALAERVGSSPGTVGVRLSRARAKLRLEHLLALIGSTSRRGGAARSSSLCPPGTAFDNVPSAPPEHLLACPSCGELSPALPQKRRWWPGLWPIALLGEQLRRLRRQARTQPAPAGAMGVGAAAVVAAVVMAWPRPSSSPPPRLSSATPPSAEEPWGGTLSAAGRRVPLADEGLLRQSSGRAVDGRRLLVQSVPTDEGLWAGCDPARVWVQLTGGGESPFTLRPGQRVNFVGQPVPNPPGFSEMIGLTSTDGVTDLDRQGVHIAVGFTSLTLVP